MGMKVYGAEELKAILRNVAVKVPEIGRKTMHRGADKIQATAQLYAPEDTGALVESIHQEVIYETRGRLRIDIVVGGVVDGIDVDDYASEVNENYERMGKDGGPTKPGSRTLIKRQENPGVYIGEKFLDRAVADQAPKLERAVIDAVIITMTEESGIK